MIIFLFFVDEHSTAVPFKGGFFSGSVEPDQDWPQNDHRIVAHEWKVCILTSFVSSSQANVLLFLNFTRLCT